MAKSTGGGTGLSAVKREMSAGQPQMRIEETILIDDFEEDDSPVYIKLNYDNKENKLITKSLIKSSASTHDMEVDEAVKASQAHMDPETASLNELFTGEKEKLLLLQISEALQFHDIPSDGRVGKLRVRASGKIELVINDDINFEMTLSTSSPFYQVCI